MLGIDLGGARMATTGWVVLAGDTRPRVVSAGRLSKAKTVGAAEAALANLIVDTAADVVAVDAPLTLPPCLTCPSFCAGPDEQRCELRAARLVWSANGNPLTERLCEVRLREELAAGPLPTMRIGQIAARGVALARRLAAEHLTRSTGGSPQLLEVYPYASLTRLSAADGRLAPRNKDEAEQDYASRILDGFSVRIDGIDDHRPSLQNVHVLDGLIAAYTGWLAPGGLEPPPAGFNVASGWIWLPAKERAGVGAT